MHIARTSVLVLLVLCQLVLLLLTQVNLADLECMQASLFEARAWSTVKHNHTCASAIGGLSACFASAYTGHCFPGC